MRNGGRVMVVEGRGGERGSRKSRMVIGSESRENNEMMGMIITEGWKAKWGK